MHYVRASGFKDMLRKYSALFDKELCRYLCQMSLSPWTQMLPPILQSSSDLLRNARLCRRGVRPDGQRRNFDTCRVQ